LENEGLIEAATYRISHTRVSLMCSNSFCIDDCLSNETAATVVLSHIFTDCGRRRIGGFSDSFAEFCFWSKTGWSAINCKPTGLPPLQNRLEGCGRNGDAEVARLARDGTSERLANRRPDSSSSAA